MIRYLHNPVRKFEIFWTNDMKKLHIVISNQMGWASCLAYRLFRSKSSRSNFGGIYEKRNKNLSSAYNIPLSDESALVYRLNIFYSIFLVTAKQLQDIIHLKWIMKVYLHFALVCRMGVNLYYNFQNFVLDTCILCKPSRGK